MGKGQELYKKARNGEIKNFTGLDAPYEEPLECELVLMSLEAPPSDLAAKVVELLKQKHILL